MKNADSIKIMVVNTEQPRAVHDLAKYVSLLQEESSYKTKHKKNVSFKDEKVFEKSSGERSGFQDRRSRRGSTFHEGNKSQLAPMNANF